MEVGAVKQAFNNEVIHLKKPLNKAKVHTIHKLTRKAKKMTEGKVKDALKEKLKRKGQNVINEVLVIKKIKPKDIAKFAVIHKGELNSYLNRSGGDQEKACARLLLHPSLQQQYKLFRTRFSSMPIDQLSMTQKEKKMLKKEVRDKKKVNKNNTNKAHTGGKQVVDDLLDKEHENNTDEDYNIDEDEIEKQVELRNDSENGDSDSENDEKFETERDSDDEVSENSVGQFVKLKPAITDDKIDSASDDNEKVVNSKIVLSNVTKMKINKPEKTTSSRSKQNKNKNLNEKLTSRKFKKDSSDAEVQDVKIVDPFFITSTGENYMSLAEPRQPDEVKEEHKQGNRRLRRAAMFGHVPKIKPKRIDNYDENNDRFNKQNNFNRNNSKDNSRNGFNDNKRKFDKVNTVSTEPEKLHPSWEAKKRQSGILPFQGKKIVFNES